MDQRAHPSGVIPCNFPTSRESCFHPNRIHSQWPGSLSLLRRAGARAHVCDRIGSAARLAGLLERLTSPSLLRIAVLRAIECWSVVGRHEGPGAKIRTHCLSWSPFVARTLPLMDRQPRRSSFAPAVDIGPLLIGLGARCSSAVTWVRRFPVSPDHFGRRCTKHREISLFSHVWNLFAISLNKRSTEVLT